MRVEKSIQVGPGEKWGRRESKSIPVLGVTSFERQTVDKGKERQDASEAACSSLRKCHVISNDFVNLCTHGFMRLPVLSCFLHVAILLVERRNVCL